MTQFGAMVPRSSRFEIEACKFGSGGDAELGMGAVEMLGGRTRAEEVLWFRALPGYIAT
jgi:hypothetical protein